MTTKEQIASLLRKGDKRSYNEIAADLELQKWYDRFHPTNTTKNEEVIDAPAVPDSGDNS